MNIEHVFQAICNNPEDDDLRLEYAKLIESSDPAHAKLIRIQVKYANEHRCSSDYSALEEDEDGLIRRHGARWAHNIAKFSARDQLRSIEFDRGFPARIEMHPDIFAEYADLVFRLAPIRHIDFISPYDEDGKRLEDEHGKPIPFPIDRVLACPQLSRLDSVGFVNVELKPSYRDHPGDVTKIAQCPHLTRCLYLNFAFTTITDHAFLELAEGELTGKMLVVRPLYVGERRVEDIEIGMGEYTRTDFSDEWKAVERRLGYVPWLHPSHNGVSRFDARWHLEHGKLPKYPPGSPQQPEWYDIPREWKRRSW